MLPGVSSSNTSSGHVKKNIKMLTGDMMSKAAAMLGGLSSELPGRNKFGPKTVAKLFRDILLNSTLSATLLEEMRMM